MYTRYSTQLHGKLQDGVSEMTCVAQIPLQARTFCQVWGRAASAADLGCRVSLAAKSPFTQAAACNSGWARGRHKDPSISALSKTPGQAMPAPELARGLAKALMGKHHGLSFPSARSSLHTSFLSSWFLISVLDPNLHPCVCCQRTQQYQLSHYNML